MPDPAPSTRRPVDPDATPRWSYPITVALTVAIGVLVVALALLIWYAVDVLVIVFAGVLVGVMLRGLSDWLVRRTGLSHGWALGLVVIALAAIGALIGWFVVPDLAAQLGELTQKLPQAWGRTRAWLEAREWGRHALRLVPTDGQWSLGGSNALGRVTGIASTTLNALLTLVLVSFLGLYLAAEPELYVKGVLHLVPKAHRGHARHLLAEVGRALRGWLIGQGIDMVFVGILSAIGLWWLGIPLWQTLALLTAATNFIPNFGAILAFIPAALIAATMQPSKVWQVTVLCVVVQSIEGYLFQPFIARRTVALPPALTILTQVLLGALLGPLGVVVATPLVAALMVAVKMLYVRDVLGDPVPVQPKEGA